MCFLYQESGKKLQNSNPDFDFQRFIIKTPLFFFKCNKSMTCIFYFSSKCTKSIESIQKLFFRIENIVSTQQSKLIHI